MDFQTVTIREAWGQLGRKLAILIPAKLVTWLDAPKREAKRQHPLTILIVLLIACLSTASVTNLFTRADVHHPGISAYATGAGLALLVPLSIFFAVYVPLGRWGRAGAWAISLVFAGMSAAIQYKIYASGATDVSLEAVAFGAGIPVAECLLAVLEGILINHLAREAARKAVAAQEAAKAEQARIQAELAAAEAKAEQERQRRAAEAQAVALAEQKRLAAEAEALALAEQKRIQAEHQAAELAFALEAKRQKLALDLELKRAAAQAKLSKNVDSVKQRESNQGESKRRESNQDESKLIQFYRLNAKATQREAADSTGLSQSKVNRILDRLKKAELVTVNGHGVQFKEQE